MYIYIPYKIVHIYRIKLYIYIPYKIVKYRKFAVKN